jgi:hypothetical protein
MKIHHGGLDWDIGTSQFTEYDDDGFLGAQLDVHGEKNPGGPPYEVHSPFGFASRPLDPDDAGKGCQTLYAREGGRGHAWFLGDPRVQDKIPALKKGASALYSAFGAFFHLETNDETSDPTATLYVPVEWTGGGPLTGTPSKAHAVTVGIDGNGDRVLNLVHADGMALLMTAGGKNSVIIKNKAGDAFLEVNDDGVINNGNAKQMGSLAVGVDAIAGDTTQPVVNESLLIAWINGVLIPALATAAPAKVVTPLAPGVTGTTKLKAI